MKLSDFEYIADHEIVKRGKAYFNQQAVINLEEVEDDKWQAEVIGSNTYTVLVEVYEDEIVDSECDCPYDWGVVCKHEIAVFFELKRLKSDSSYSRTPRQTPMKVTQDILQHLSMKELKQFILEYAKGDRKFRHDFIQEFREIGDSFIEAKTYAKNEIHYAISLADAEIGYLDYNACQAFGSSLSPLLEKLEEYINLGKEAQSVAIAQALIEEIHVIATEADDSSGQLGYMIDQGMETLRHIASSSTDESLKADLFKYVQRERQKSVYRGWELDGQWWIILTQLADIPDRVEEALQSLDLQLGYDQHVKDYSARYRFEQLSRLKLHIYQEYFPEKAEKFMQDSVHLPSFRKELIEKCIALQQWKEAIRLAKEGIEQDAANEFEGLVIEWRVYLTRIYRGKGDLKKCFQELKILFDDSYKFEYYEELKASCSPEQWPSERIIIITKLEKSAKENRWQTGLTTLCKIYKEEQMWQPLWTVIQQSGKLSLLQEYEKKLLPLYQAEIVVFYMQHIRKTAEYTGRQYYQEIASHLSHMLHLHAFEQVEHLIDELLNKYRNRRAMKEELQKVRKQQV